MKSEQKGFAYTEAKGICVGRLYRTNVVVYDRNAEELEITDGGWATVSTTKAINTALSRIPLPIRVKRVRGELKRVSNPPRP